MKTFVANIPRRHIIKLGKLLGILLYITAIPQRRLVRRNLQFCYPDWHQDHVRELSKRIFENAGITLLEFCQGAFLSPEDLLGMFRIRGEENLVKALEGNNGVILISAHLGNWELAPQFLCCYLRKPFTGVARKIGFKWLDHWVHHLRTHLGTKIIDKKEALPKMMQCLRRGEMLGLFVDQSKRKQGVEVNLFGREASATPAAALLALRCKSPVLPVFCIREADGKLTLDVKAPLELKRTKDLRSDLQANTQIMMDAVEDMIREHLEQWAWYQRPWKKAYPDLYPEWEARRQQRKLKKKRRKTSKAA
jgi:KDO2-lipid IV(A) lauroyltransferase